MSADSTGHASVRVPVALLSWALTALGCVGCGGCKIDVAGPAVSLPPTENPYGPGVVRSLHLTLGVPYDGDPSDDELLVKPQYAASYNRRRHGANWVSWSLRAHDYGPVPRYRGKFLPDESLPFGFYRVRHEDYTGSGYDRGHLVRSEERTATAEDNRATFLLSNILPQTHELNAGPWLALEEYCRLLVPRNGRELFVLAGGIPGTSEQVIGAGIVVPEAFFKVIVVMTGGSQARDVTAQTRVIATRFPNQHEGLAVEWTAYRTTVDEIERATGYELLSDVDPAVQALVEASVDGG